MALKETLRRLCEAAAGCFVISSVFVVGSVAEPPLEPVKAVRDEIVIETANKSKDYAQLVARAEKLVKDEGCVTTMVQLKLGIADEPTADSKPKMSAADIEKHNKALLGQQNALLTKLYGTPSVHGVRRFSSDVRAWRPYVLVWTEGKQLQTLLSEPAVTKLTVSRDGGVYVASGPARQGATANQLRKRAKEGPLWMTVSLDALDLPPAPNGGPTTPEQRAHYDKLIKAMGQAVAKRVLGKDKTNTVRYFPGNPTILMQVDGEQMEELLSDGQVLHVSEDKPKP